MKLAWQLWLKLLGMLIAMMMTACVSHTDSGHEGESTGTTNSIKPSDQANETLDDLKTKIERETVVPEKDKHTRVAVVDTLTSADVNQSPDASVAGAMQRVQGIKVDRARNSLAKVEQAASPSVAYSVKEAVAPMYEPMPAPYYHQDVNTEKYQHIKDNPVHLVSEQPVSTFSVDVDTGSYANVRRYLNSGALPPQDAVRVEEMINYFDYHYAPPADRSTPFKVSTELAASPWNSNAILMKVGIKGYEIDAKERPAANLVFLIDVSGSMNEPNKLPLLKKSFNMMVDQLSASDRVAIVVYAGTAGVVLDSTPGNEKAKIRGVLDKLEAGGSTNGAQGITRAYQLAHDHFVKNGINRVVLATDGDFNVGVVNFESLLDMAKRERTSGVALTTLGFGEGNYNDQLMEQLADAGNGNYAYVDTLNEARKVLVSELSSTLFTIAKDVKIQVEFNPATVKEYRLIGYENRALAREDFNNDKVDAGEIGAGHRVTALYEIIPANSKGLVDSLRYGSATSTDKAARGDEFALLRLRYKQPDADSSKLLEYPIKTNAVVAKDQMSTDLRFAASVAAFGQLLRGGRYVDQFSYADVIKLANSGAGEDVDGYRHEFMSLVKLANEISARTAATSGKHEGRMAER
ncbi:MAG TPA: VWA domain-containing protein [Steroidobacteraceae bacterium]|nr:VWA domain-containing protein [Steroidobacteraceae bacterium]